LSLSSEKLVSKFAFLYRYDKEDVALTEVLDAIHVKFPPAKLAEMNEDQAVGHMQDVLMEIRAELTGKTAETADGKSEAVETTEGGEEGGDIIVEAADNGAGGEEAVAVGETAAAAAAAGEGDEKKEKAAARPVTLSDLASLAGAAEVGRCKLNPVDP
jgi:hypothetical protein